MFPNAEKASMVVRLTAAAGALGVGRVLVATDTFRVSAATRETGAAELGHGYSWAALSESQQRVGGSWPAWRSPPRAGQQARR